MIETVTTPEFSFLQSSETGRHIKRLRWSAHELGEISGWDPVLLNSLNIVLESGFPMVLYWGDNNICFYNDAFKPTLGAGSQQLAGIGEPLSTVFPEVFEGIDTLISQVKQSGDRVFFDDIPSAINRKNGSSETYWTYSYSPVRDLYGSVKGVLAVCIETTDKVNAYRLASERAQSLRNLFTQAPVGLLIVRGPDRRIDFLWYMCDYGPT